MIVHTIWDKKTLTFQDLRDKITANTILESLDPERSSSFPSTIIIMASYRIYVRNKSGKSRDYFLYTKAPGVSSGTQTYQTVHLSAPGIPHGTGAASFDVYKEYFAVAGTSSGHRVNSNVSVTTSHHDAAKFRLHDSEQASNLTMTGPPDKTSASSGDIQSQSEQDYNSNGNYVIRHEPGALKLESGGESDPS